MEKRRNSSTLRRIKERRKKKRIMLAAALVSGVLISGLAFAGVRGLVRSISGGEAKTAGESYPDKDLGLLPGNETKGTEEQASVSIPQEVFPAGVSAGRVDLTGLTMAQAEKKLKEAYRWRLQVSDGADQVVVPDYLAGWLEDVTGRLRSDVLPDTEELQPDYDALKQRFKEFASELAGQWDSQPVSSQAESFDRASGVYTYSEEKRGRALDQEALADSLLQAVEEGRMDAVVPVGFAVLEPERTRQQAKAQYQVIGTFTTKTTDNKNRNQNIKLAVDAIDGTVLQPGEEFSFNMATGNRTSEKGYQPAGAYKNGVLIEEPGGGVCQVSTTLYHAIIESGFRTTERNAHSFAPSYVEKGQDAMVSFDGYAGPDLKFVNTGSASVVLRAAFSGRELKMSIVGLPILDEGVEVSIRSEKVRDVEPGEAVYEENPALAYGSEKVVEAPTPGSVWKSYRVLKKNGEVIEEKPLHNSSYKPKNGVIHRNTTVQNPVGAETGEAAGGGAGTTTGTGDVTNAGTAGGTGETPGTGAANQNGAENGQTGAAGQIGAPGGQTSAAGDQTGASGGQAGASGDQTGASGGQAGAGGQTGTSGGQTGASGQTATSPSQGQVSGGPEGILVEPHNAVDQAL